MSHTIAPVLGEATVQELREAVRGEILIPADDGYADAARIWNGAHDGHRPALVVRCRGVADVIAAVGFARSNDLTIAVRGGGHSVAGFSTNDDGIVIDLSPMHGVRVDPAARRASAGGGAIWAGGCAAAAATSASSRSSSSTCIRSARRSMRGRSSIPPPRPAICCTRSVSGRRVRLTM